MLFYSVHIFDLPTFTITKEAISTNVVLYICGQVFAGNGNHEVDYLNTYIINIFTASNLHTTGIM